ncbi:helix-turn-helix transcriptional regulator [Hespellia stercorisuis]|nr:AraC family transcriptional regulator [Hespellia stercorisuis]
MQMRVELDIKKDQSEKIAYNIPEFPVYIRRGMLSAYPDFHAISHWHDDIELILVQSGHMEYRVNGETVRLEAGQGIFVNTRQFHHGFSKEREECIFLCALFHPMLLCSSPYVEKQYVTPVMENAAMPYYVFDLNREEEREVPELIEELYRISTGELFAMEAQPVLFGLWENLFRLSGQMQEKSVPQNNNLTILKEMIRFIYKNYAERVSLEQISQAGKVGKTTCCAIFKKYTNETPISYLTNYRLKKGMELLETTEENISEICFEVGFSGASYFTETFRKTYGCTPSEYRHGNVKYMLNP